MCMTYSVKLHYVFFSQSLQICHFNVVCNTAGRTELIRLFVVMTVAVGWKMPLIFFVLMLLPTSTKKTSINFYGHWEKPVARLASQAHYDPLHSECCTGKAANYFRL